MRRLPVLVAMLLSASSALAQDTVIVRHVSPPQDTAVVVRHLPAAQDGTPLITRIPPPPPNRTPVLPGPRLLAFRPPPKDPGVGTMLSFFVPGGDSYTLAPRERARRCCSWESAPRSSGCWQASRTSGITATRMATAGTKRRLVATGAVNATAGILDQPKWASASVSRRGRLGSQRPEPTWSAGTKRTGCGSSRRQIVWVWRFRFPEVMFHEGRRSTQGDRPTDLSLEFGR